MQTRFTAAQLASPRIAEANGILRKCVHCGFCTATCPTYVLLGDERDSPRGRIYLIKNMLETGEAATAETVTHIDRCLSCLACVTTCPSGVDYMRLIDEARAHVEETYRRPLADRGLRLMLAAILPRPALFRWTLAAARMTRWLGPILQGLGARRLAALLDLAPRRKPPAGLAGGPGTYGASGARKGRVALLQGCVQSVLDPGINAATIRLLTRLGYEVVVGGGESCCGSLTHHMGYTADARARARHMIDNWTEARVDWVIITASGCGTTIKDYGHMLRHDPNYAKKARDISARARDITEFLAAIDLPEGKGDLPIAYHAACSLQHGQKIRSEPLTLLRRAGFTVFEVPEGHLCCGSAGTYNMLQPDLARQLRDRKVAAIESVAPAAIAAGNLGCITQIGAGTRLPILHTVEFLDWAYGGPRPERLARRREVR